jgi:hypothetical protein
MATNLVINNAHCLSLPCSDPTTPAENAPVRFGALTGVALTAEGEGGNSAANTTVELGQHVWDLSVKGVDGSGNSAVAVGDTIFYVDADTPKLSKKTSGYFFGYAMEAVGSGETATIQVLHVQSPGSGALGSGTVGESNLAAGAVTAAKLSATIKTGFLPVPLTAVREVFSNAITNIAGNGGVLASDTTPILNFTNGDTDSALRLAWAASNSDPIIFQVPLPPDLDEASVVEVHFRAAMAGATDTPVISADSYFNEGDTKVEDDSAAVTGTSYAEYTITIAAADVPAGAQTMSCELTPGAHTTDILYITAIWVEYTRA